jgi:hypothetical protein
MIDLDTLIPPTSGIQLQVAVAISDRGEITTDGLLSNGEIHAVLLIPCDEDHLDMEGCDYSLVDADGAPANSRPGHFLQPAQRPHHSRRTNRR